MRTVNRTTWLIFQMNEKKTKQKQKHSHTLARSNSNSNKQTKSCKRCGIDEREWTVSCVFHVMIWFLTVVHDELAHKNVLASIAATCSFIPLEFTSIRSFHKTFSFTWLSFEVINTVQWCGQQLFTSVPVRMSMLFWYKYNINNTHTHANTHIVWMQINKTHESSRCPFIYCAQDKRSRTAGSMLHRCIGVSVCMCVRRAFMSLTSIAPFAIMLAGEKISFWGQHGR